MPSYKYKNRSNKNKSQKRKNRNSKKNMRGGGDFFIQGNNAASFNDVPMRSFYPMNNLAEGTDVQHMQQSSRLMGGSRKRKTNKKSNKRNKNKRTLKQRGGGLSNFFTSGYSNTISDSGNLRGLPVSSNILAGKDAASYGPIPVNIVNKSPLV